ncbi:13489_t:CDS:1, partial [Racocetra persica]
LFASYPRPSAKLLTFLKQALRRDTKEICIEPEVGRCYDIFKDSIVGSSVFQLGENVMSPTGFKIPHNIQIDDVNETFVWNEQFKNKQEYVRKRLSDLGLSIDVPLNFEIRQGYSVDSSANNSSHTIEQTFLIEHHCFKFTLNVDELQLSQTFIDDIDTLPSKYDKSNNAKWKNFFDKYGIYVVQSAWVGGRCSVTVKIASFSINIQSIGLIMSEVLAFIFNHKTQLDFDNEIKELNTVEEALNTARLMMHGGDPKYHVTTFHNCKFNSKKWLNSIKVKPAVLDTKLELIPINIVAGNYKSNIIDPMATAIEDLFGIKPTYINPEIKALSFPKNREEATNSLVKDPGTCLRSGTLISMADGTKVAVEKLNPGDLVVGKNGMPCHVLGRNEVLLGNRFLYGFSSGRTAFFTSEHLFATQNDEWMCIDPDLSRLINPQN